ncbi:MAG: hypothetical protein JW795_00985 [Chitinivibrionales bacterium]|nr:hypothetical protein [Chitinivibrionales bacterium]
MKRNILLGAFVMFGIVSALNMSNAQAYTAQEIVNSVVDELDNVNDCSASIDVDYDDPEVYDMTDGTLQWKIGSGVQMSKMVLGTPYSGTFTVNGEGMNILDKYDKLHYYNLEATKTTLRYRYGTDLFNVIEILEDETWTKDPTTDTINDIECYKVYTTKNDSNYEVWIDTSSMKKVIRVKTTDYDNDLHWQVDYDDYSNVESTAQLPATVVMKLYYAGNIVMSMTYTFSDIDINEGLSSSIFNVTTNEEWQQQ